MRSEFNTVFDNVITEMTFLSPEEVKRLNQKVDSKKDTSTPSSNNTSTNTTSTSTGSANQPQFKDNSGGFLKGLIQAGPNILKTLDAQEKFWTGKADISLGNLAELLKGYNDKKALNAMHGIIDYTKSKNPTLIMKDNDMIRTINQQLLQKQNENK